MSIGISKSSPDKLLEMDNQVKDQSEYVKKIKEAKWLIKEFTHKKGQNFHPFVWGMALAEALAEIGDFVDSEPQKQRKFPVFQTYSAHIYGLLQEERMKAACQTAKIEIHQK